VAAVARIAAARTRLAAARRQRPPPHIDTKIVAAWNGLAISAFARAGAALGEPRFVEDARVAAGFVLDHMRPNGRLQRTWTEHTAYEDAFLDDHAFLAAGLLDLYEATFEPRWLGAAVAIADAMTARFWDDEAGGYFLTPADRPVAIARAKPIDEGAMPSGNAVAAATTLRLAEITGDERWRRRGEDVLRACGAGLIAAPSQAPRLLGALDFLLDRPREIAIVHPAGGGRDDALLAAVRRHYAPNHVLAVATEGADLATQSALVPFLADKRALHGRTTAYVCEHGVCALPTHDPDVLARQIAAVAPLPTPGAPAARVDAAAGR
jgi:uncharacterized protein YyaL (SSP411 family)